MSAGAPPRLVCLLPVRNSADIMPEWLDEAGRFADAVVALDDGSTDDTGRVLAAHPLVTQVLTNRCREGYLGWHDGVNRNRLLAAAADLSPEWIFFLDVDERLDPTDADALRLFVTNEALASVAYGFRVYRMLAGERYDPAYQLVYRLFRFHSGQRLPHRRLNAMPVPTDVPALMQTTLRIKHYGEVGEEGRQARIDKLREADPEGLFLPWYQNLPPLSPGPHPRWTPRTPTTPVLATEPQPGAVDVDLEAELEALDLAGPVLTVAILAGDGEEAEALSTLAALAGAELPAPTQLLLVTTEAARGSSEAVEGVEVVRVPSVSSPAAIRNAALKAARGDYVTFLTVPAPIDASGLAALLAVHQQGHALVGGTLVNMTATPAGWAGFLLDQPVGSPDTPQLPTTAYSSFAREALRDIGGFDEGTAAPEALAAHRLLRRGFTGTVLPELRLARRPDPSARALLRDRFRLGRAMVSADEHASSGAVAGVASIGGATVRQAAAKSRQLATVADDAAAPRLAVTALVWGGAAATWMGAAREALARRRRPEKALS